VGNQDLLVKMIIEMEIVSLFNKPEVRNVKGKLKAVFLLQSCHRALLRGLFKIHSRSLSYKKRGS
jgi:hypothetical protein